MKGVNAMEFCEEQMCEIVPFWLKAQFSINGQIGTHAVTSVRVREGNFRIVLEPKPKEVEQK